MKALDVKALKTALLDAGCQISIEVSKTDTLFNVKAIAANKQGGKNIEVKTAFCRYKNGSFSCTNDKASAELIRISEHLKSSVKNFNSINIVIKAWSVTFTFQQDNDLIQVSVFKDSDIVLVADKLNLGNDKGSFNASTATAQQKVFVDFAHSLLYADSNDKAA